MFGKQTPGWDRVICVTYCSVTSQKAQGLFAVPTAEALSSVPWDVQAAAAPTQAQTESYRRALAPSPPCATCDPAANLTPSSQKTYPAKRIHLPVNNASEKVAACRGFKSAVLSSAIHTEP